MRTPEISPSEWKVMKVLWAKAPQPAYDIINSLAETEDWHPNTVKTLLSRLCKKKAIGARKYKNLYLYHPLATQSDCIEAESDSFLNRLFGGSVKPLLVHFAEQKKLTKKDLEDLHRILDGKGK
jgi:BlaI family penicillinase repressor